MCSQKTGMVTYISLNESQPSTCSKVSSISYSATAARESQPSIVVYYFEKARAKDIYAQKSFFLQCLFFPVSCVHHNHLCWRMHTVLSLLVLLVQKYKYWHRRSCRLRHWCWRRWENRVDALEQPDYWASQSYAGLQHRRHRRFLSTWEPKEKWRRDIWRPCQQLLKLSRHGVPGKGNVSDLVLALWWCFLPFFDWRVQILT